MPHDRVPGFPRELRILVRLLSSLLNRLSKRRVGCDLLECRSVLHLLLNEPGRASLAQEKPDEFSNSRRKIREEVDALKRVQQCRWLYILEADRNDHATALALGLPRQHRCPFKLHPL